MKQQHNQTLISRHFSFLELKLRLENTHYCCLLQSFPSVWYCLEGERSIHLDSYLFVDKRKTTQLLNAHRSKTIGGLCARAASFDLSPGAEEKSLGFGVSWVQDQVFLVCSGGYWMGERRRRVLNLLHGAGKFVETSHLPRK